MSLTGNDFIFIYHFLENYDAALEQRYLNYQNWMYGHMREFDTLDYMDLMEIYTQRRFLRTLRADLLVLCRELLDNGG